MSTETDKKREPAVYNPTTGDFIPAPATGRHLQPERNTNK